ncbi:MAG: nucleotidyltransferase family protein [Thermodesulfobacteriota bacterium]|nr:nucleotidyltransferase family protein [Thermodesulfobacteriota bacterium]
MKLRLAESRDNITLDLKELLLIKGAPLSYTLYPEPSFRPRCDTDLLFPDRASAEKGWSIVQERGYQRPNAVSGEIISHEFSCCKTGPASIGHNLDLHWRLSNNQLFARLFDFDELAHSAVKVPQLNNADTLGPEHALLLACVHRIQHKTEQQENRLIWLYDIHLLCRSFSPAMWQQFLAAAQKKQLCSICLDGLRSAMIFPGTSVPESTIL